jgi:hypothetical protein
VRAGRMLSGSEALHVGCRRATALEKQPSTQSGGPNSDDRIDRLNPQHQAVIRPFVKTRWVVASRDIPCSEMTRPASSGAKDMGHNYNQEAQGRFRSTGGYFPRVSAMTNCGSIFWREVFHGHVRHPQPLVS